MKKRIGFGYLVSTVAPIIALLVLVLRLFDPHSRAVSIGLYLAGVVTLVLSVRAHARVRRKLSLVKTHAQAALMELGLWRKRAAFAFVVFGTTLLIFPVLIPMESSAFLREDRGALGDQFDAASAQIERSEYFMTLAHLRLEEMVSRASLADRSSLARIEDIWAQYLDHAILLDRLVNSHKHFYQLAVRSPSLADRGFLLGYHAHAVQMNSGYFVVRHIESKPFLAMVLDEGDLERGIPRGTYTAYRRGVMLPESLVRLEAGYGYLKLLGKAGRLTDDLGLREHVHELSRATIKLFGRDPASFVDAPLDRLEQRAHRAWFPIQKGAAEVVSPVRTKKRENFISQKDIAWARENLRAGDILLQRRNWYLTNLGIPGFWPHAALYVGSLAELDEEFGQDARGATSELAPSEYIERNLPQAFLALTKLDAKGRSARVIEAVGEGVVLQSFESSGHADYMAAMRPILGPDERLRVVLRALEHLGKPYDYDFDFSTDDSLVCSELVQKAMQSDDPKKTIHFPLTRMNGRLLLPPNDMARTFDETYGKREQQLDFVFFLDGNEALGRATFNDVDAFRRSWRRPKWDISQP